MTDTARSADIVLAGDNVPGARRHLHRGRPPAPAIAPKVIDPPDGCHSNHEAIAGLARRVGAEHPAFSMPPREIIDWTLRESGYGDLATLERERRESWFDLQPAFEEAHFLNGFGFPDGKFRFKADCPDAAVANDGLRGPWREMPSLSDHWSINDEADEERPFKLATSPARNFLNSSFTETPTSRPRTATRSADQSVGCEQASALGRRHRSTRQ
jgi:anaerobic selenocysteine-containing dehydrogenase